MQKSALETEEVLANLIPKTFYKIRLIKKFVRTCNSLSVTSISPQYTNSMIAFKLEKQTPGRMMVGCLHGLSRRSVLKYAEHADSTIWHYK